MTHKENRAKVCKYLHIITNLSPNDGMICFDEVRIEIATKDGHYWFGSRFKGKDEDKGMEYASFCYDWAEEIIEKKADKRGDIAITRLSNSQLSLIDSDDEEEDKKREGCFCY